MNNNIWEPKQFETFEEFCDWTMERLVEQGRRSYDDDLGCMYTTKAKDGTTLHCAIGFHIPPNSNANTEISDITNLLKAYDFPHLSRWGTRRLRLFQEIHDSSGRIFRKTYIDELYTKTFLKSVEEIKPQYQAWVNLGN